MARIVSKVFDPYSYVKEIVLQKEEDFSFILWALDPEEEIKVKYCPKKDSFNVYKISFSSKVLFVDDIQAYIPDTIITAVWED